MGITIKRVYDKPAPNDGYRVLVDRVWPRGMRKDRAKLDTWSKDVAPSAGLRTWFGHRPDRWEEFKRRYFAELDGRKDAWGPLRERAAKGTLTLVYGSREPRYNNAVALREYLQAKASQ